jgi:CRP/FNR family transcriptional regulator, cyclic AMP receptor protein
MTVRVPLHLGQVVHVLEADPDLGQGLPQPDFEAARRQAVARILEAEPGPLAVPPDGPFADPSTLGWLVLEGVLTRAVSIGSVSATEVLGPGDLLRPWISDDEFATEPAPAEWRVLERARFAMLDRGFARRVAFWPEVLGALMGRTVNRARRLAVQMALGHVNRVDARLLLLFWRLADRWGHRTPEGVVVGLSMSHASLGTLIGAQRPSVTTALTKLAERELVVRRPDGSWLLLGDPPDPDELMAVPRQAAG